MADPTSPHAGPSPPQPKRVRRWPTAVTTGLLTLAAAYLLERYVLPTQGWWVVVNHGRYRSEPEFLEAVYDSNLSAEAKVTLTAWALQTDSLRLEFVRDRLVRDVSPYPFFLHREWVTRQAPAIADLVAAVLSSARADERSVSCALDLLLLGCVYGTDPASDEPRRTWYHLISQKCLEPLTQWSTNPSLPPGHRKKMTILWSLLGHQHVTRIYDDPVVTKSYFPLDMLITSLSDPDPEVRKHAARALGFYVGGSEDTTTVIGALRSRLRLERSGDSLPVAVEIIHSLGLLAERDDPATRSFLLAILDGDRPPPPGTAGVTQQVNSPPEGILPWYTDQCLRAESILALRRLREKTAPRDRDPVDTKVMASLRGWSADCPWTEYERLAAAVYLKDCDHPQAPATLLDTFRRVVDASREDLPKLDEDRVATVAVYRSRYALVATLLDSLTFHRAAAADVTSVLITKYAELPWPKKRDYIIWLIPPTVSFRHYANLGQSRRLRDGWGFHEPRVAWWREVPWVIQDSMYKVDRWAFDEMMERVGRPGKADLPALRALLDNQGVSGWVRAQAASALLRDATADLRDPRRVVLEQVSAGPAHPELIQQARLQLARMPPEGR